MSEKAHKRSEAKRARGAPQPGGPPPGRPWLLPSLLVGGSTLGCALFLLVTGARFSASSLFLLIASIAFGLTLQLFWLAGRALWTRDERAEIQVATGRRRKELEREKQSLVKALKELEFDHEMGKISDADHREIAATYRARALRVMRQLDESGVDYRKLIEYDLAAHRKPGTPVQTTETIPVSAPIVVPPAAVAPVAATAPRALSRLLCANCTTDNEPDATFCKKCGKPIERVA